MKKNAFTNEKTNTWNKLSEETAIELLEHYLPQDEQSCHNYSAEMKIIGKQEYKSLVIIIAQYKERVDSYYMRASFVPRTGTML